MDSLDNLIDYIEEWMEFLSKLPKPVLIVGVILLLFSSYVSLRVNKNMDPEKKKELVNNGIKLAINKGKKFVKNLLGEEIPDYLNDLALSIYNAFYGNDEENLTKEQISDYNDPKNSKFKKLYIDKKKEDINIYEITLSTLNTLEILINNAKKLKKTEDMKNTIERTRSSINKKILIYKEQINCLLEGKSPINSPNYKDTLTPNVSSVPSVPHIVSNDLAKHTFKRELFGHFSLSNQDKETLDDYNIFINEKEYIDKYNNFFKKIYKQYQDKNQIDENDKRDENLDKFIKEIERNLYKEEIKNLIRQFGKIRRKSKKKNSKKLKKRRKIRRRSRIA
jgi:hypothetical protein